MCLCNIRGNESKLVIVFCKQEFVEITNLTDVSEGN